MKRNCYLPFISILIVILCSRVSYLSPVNVRDYLHGRFPAIFMIYLSSLENLDPGEMEFIDLLEGLPANEQRVYAMEVHEKGFSRDLLDRIKQGLKKEEALSLHVAYPSQTAQRIGNSPLYVFGKAEPSTEVTVTVNDENVQRFDSRTGHFLTLVEVPEGEEFSIVVAASRGGERTSVERKVFYPRIWEEMPQDPLAIHASHALPVQDQALREGDQLNVFIQGSPGAEAVFRIGERIHEVLMMEINDLPETLKGRGFYRGSYTVQAEDVPSLGKTSPQTITVILQREGHKVSRTLPGRICFDSGLSPHIVEVTGDRTRIYKIKEDSFVFHTTTLGGDGIPAEVVGYDLLPGTLLEVVGISGEYLRIRLGADDFLIHRDRVTERSDMIDSPFSVLSNINIEETSTDIEYRFNVKERIPFLIENETHMLRLNLFGAEKGEHFIQEGKVFSLHEMKIENSALEEVPSLMITIELDHSLTGFDYFWDGTDLVIKIRKPPEISKNRPISGRTIVIDPGHGGDFRGAIGPGDLHEKDVVLEVGIFLRDILEDLGAKVIMTRTGDVNIDLYKRINTAIENHADLFISIHANAHTAGADAVNYHGHMTLYNDHYNQRLAEIMMDHLVERIGLPRTRIWQRSDLVVLRYPQIPSVLVETAYMMHPDDNWYLLQTEYQREFAEAIADGIIEYFLML